MPTKKQSIEYRLLVQRAYDDMAKKEGILFRLETSKLFTNFSYHIDVHEHAVDNKIVWSLHGLRAPSMNMPSTGAAQYQKMYFHLEKTVQFTLIKTGTVEASTELKFLKTSVRSSRSAVNFLKIYTDEEEFEKNRQADADVPEPKLDINRAPLQQQPTKKKRIQH